MHVTQKNGDFVYNYKLQKGISTVKGGIKVLRDLAYPDEIVLDSIKTINKLKI